jgi:8-oxo-dGTP diphosphatase
MLAGVSIPRGAWKLVKEVARHVLRRPVVGVVARALTEDGRWLLIRRSDTGGWALPGGTLEWGEDLRSSIVREVLEETGANVIQFGDLLGVYSAPERDPRFHAVTVVVAVTVSAPAAPPHNPLEILEVKLFEPEQLPGEISHGLADVIENARSNRVVWE